MIVFIQNSNNLLREIYVANDGELKISAKKEQIIKAFGKKAARLFALDKTTDKRYFNFYFDVIENNIESIKELEYSPYSEVTVYGNYVRLLGKSNEGISYFCRPLRDRTPEELYVLSLLMDYYDENEVLDQKWVYNSSFDPDLYDYKTIIDGDHSKGEDSIVEKVNNGYLITIGNGAYKWDYELAEDGNKTGKMKDSFSNSSLSVNDILAQLNDNAVMSLRCDLDKNGISFKEDFELFEVKIFDFLFKKY